MRSGKDYSNQIYSEKKEDWFSQGAKYTGEIQLSLSEIHIIMEARWK